MSNRFLKGNVDYSKTEFSKGAVCFNNNNHQYCIVLDGYRGTAEDRCSLVMEMNGEYGFMYHTPPNRALVPTGTFVDFEKLAHFLGYELKND